MIFMITVCGCRVWCYIGSNGGDLIVLGIEKALLREQCFFVLCVRRITYGENQNYWAEEDEDEEVLPLSVPSASLPL